MTGRWRKWANLVPGCPCVVKISPLSGKKWVKRIVIYTEIVICLDLHVECTRFFIFYQSEQIGRLRLGHWGYRISRRVRYSFRAPFFMMELRSFMLLSISTSGFILAFSKHRRQWKRMVYVLNVWLKFDSLLADTVVVFTLFVCI